MKYLALLAPLLVLACTEKAAPPTPVTAPPPANAAPSSAPASSAAAPSSAPAAAAESGVVASGAIHLPAGSKAEGKVVFVSLRDPAGGPPVAAKRLPAGPFPLKFAITEGDKIAMGTPRPIPAKFTLKAKLDVDGNAMSTGAGDHQATQLVDKGASGLRLELSPVAP